MISGVEVDPMQMRVLILLTLSTLAASCVDGGGNCGSTNPFSLDEELTEADVSALLESQGITDRQALECEAACTQIGYDRGGLGGDVSQIDQCTLMVDAMDGALPEDVVGNLQCGGEVTFFCEGRRPLGHVEAQGEPQGLAGYLARCAHLEAASVIAFDQLAERLERWGAPAELVARCRRAAAEEVVHAQQVGALAERMGAEVPAVEHRAVEPSLLELALDNAVEGCVHEAWAALRAEWVARHAPDPELRALYAAIASDEAGHAQLSWDLHRWLRARLDEEGRARVDAAQRTAIEALPRVAERQARVGPAALGMPAVEGCVELARRFGEGLRTATVAA